MKTADININLIDSYFTLLKSLSTDNKLELIARLSESMKTTERKEKEISLDALYGSWDSDQTADELVAELKAARNFTRKRVAL
ncbi:hypothetical protein SAMN04488511_119100 [Pedobacter suwonensis]|uniref:Uncharacterized protein n=1 Tax=Pedobacter suwonensis TaxID=332999 RepID=A0A1I0U3C2_9SPHI|nr:hypothetical protein [Pedobacter suwonensis]SFA58545.1 hypothetical protein SAMN04488511_119100 [Pedobacter suwonensis]